LAVDNDNAAETEVYGSCDERRANGKAYKVPGRRSDEDLTWQRYCLHDELIKIERITAEGDATGVTKYLEKEATEDADGESIRAILPEETHLC
jgi:hypothetical protein